MKKQEGEDPDPTPYLFVSLEQKRIDQTKPYDAKKACWVPDEKEGYLLGEIKATKGDIVTVGLPGGEVCIASPFPTYFVPRRYQIARKIMADVRSYEEKFRFNISFFIRYFQCSKRTNHMILYSFALGTLNAKD